MKLDDDIIIILNNFSFQPVTFPLSRVCVRGERLREPRKKHDIAEQPNSRQAEKTHLPNHHDDRTFLPARKLRL